MSSEPKSKINTELTSLGKDMTPTKEMIVQGKVGNGTAKSLDKQLAETIQRERTLAKAEAKLGRIEAYEQGVKDTLGDISQFEGKLVEIGNALLSKVKLGETLTRQEVETLKLVQSTIENQKKTVLAKPTQTMNHNVSILGLISNNLSNDG